MCLNHRRLLTWRRPWMFRDRIVVPWPDRYSPLPDPLHQGHNPWCIPYAVHANMTTQARILARLAAQNVPPRISLDHLVAMFQALPHDSRTLHALLLQVHHQGVVSEEDYPGDIHNISPQAIRYTMRYIRAYGPNSVQHDLYPNELPPGLFVARVQLWLTKRPLIGEIMVGQGYINSNTPLYQPNNSPPVAVAQQLQGHAMNITGEGISYEDNQSLIWEYLNSYGPDWGYRGYGEVWKTRVHHVYEAALRPWWPAPSAQVMEIWDAGALANNV